MSPEQARAVLLALNPDEATAECLSACGGITGWLYAQARSGEIGLDGAYTAEQLEAIVIWMRHPAAVFP